MSPTMTDTEELMATIEAAKNRDLPQWLRIIFFVLSALMYASAISAYVHYFEWTSGIRYTFTILLILFIIYIFSKYLFASFYRPISAKQVRENRLQQATVTLIVPVFNEPAEILRRQVESILAQTKQFAKIYYIDDGSQKDRSGIEYLQQVAAWEPIINLVELPENVGKRHAQAVVIPDITTEFIMTTDSDSLLAPDCLHNLLMPLYQRGHQRGRKISAVTGKVLASNEDTNALTRVLNIRYYNAFDTERASQTVTGSVIVASGPVTIYRTEIIQDNLDEYVNQRFLGRPQTLGDDRCLTNIALRSGKVVYQSTALVLTEIPDNLRAFRLQQTRWARSWYRETVIGIPNAIRAGRTIIVIWLVLEIVMFLAILASISLTIYWMTVPGFLDLELIGFFGFIMWNAWVRNIYYAAVSFRDFLLAPIYGYIHMFVVLPVKIYALFTMKNNSWVTRGN